MIFKWAEKLENRLTRVPPAYITAGALSAAFTMLAGSTALSDNPKYVLANAAGLTAGALVILRQAGMKEADAMKKLNIVKSAAACVQYGIGGNATGVLTNLTSITINQLFLSTHGNKLPATVNFLGKDFRTAHVISVSGAGVTTALSAPFIAHAYIVGAESSGWAGVYNAAVQALPLIANYMGIAAASQAKGMSHRLLMGGAGGVSIAYDALTGSYGMLLSSGGSLAATAIGWYKHDRQGSAANDQKLRLK